MGPHAGGIGRRRLRRSGNVSVCVPCRNRTLQYDYRENGEERTPFALILSFLPEIRRTMSEQREGEEGEERVSECQVSPESGNIGGDHRRAPES